MTWLTQQIWKTCYDMEELLPCFKGLSKDIVSTPVHCKLGRLEIHANQQDWVGYTEPNPPPLQSTVEEGEDVSMCGHWDERLTSFQKLIMIKCFKEEKVRHIFVKII